MESTPLRICLRRWALRLLLCLCPLAAAGQAEVNVKFDSNIPWIKNWLSDTSANRSARLPREIQERYPFLAQVSASRALRQARPALEAEIDRIYTLVFPAGDPAQLAARLQGSGLFEFAEVNRAFSVEEWQAYVPNDDSLARQWYHPFIRSFEAWEIERGKPQIRVGVLDTGLDYGHPEFEGQLWINPAEDLNGNGRFDPWPADELRGGLGGDFDGLDNDGNGYPDDVIGYDFTDQPRSPFGGDYLFDDPDPLDDNGHGTIVSGVISARMDNREGGAGLAPGCKLVVLRAFAATGNGDSDDIARALIYAADNGLPVVNLSFGDRFSSLTLHEAIRYAHSRGVIMASSAGNGTGDDLHYPSGYPEVLSVAATAADLSNGFEFLWPLSSYGLTVDLAAPGSDIFTPALRDTLASGEVRAYARVNGTSLAAPMVSAAAALLFSQRGVMPFAQVRGLLTSTAADISQPGWDHLTGAGRLDLLRLLQAGGNSNVAILAPAHDGGSASDSLPIVVTALHPEFQRLYLEYQRGTEDTNPWVPILENHPYQVFRDSLAWWKLSGLPEGEYTLRLRVDLSNGFTCEERIRFTYDRSPPQTQVQVAAPAWDNQERKQFWVFRSDEAAFHRLLYRRSGETEFRVLPYDRLTRNGEFLLGSEILSPGSWEWKLQAENVAGLRSETPVQSFDYQSAVIPQSGFAQKSWGLPLGRFLDRAYDLDGDGLREVISSEYDERLSFGRLKRYEWVGGQFVARDSLTQAPVLIPKDLRDLNHDGKWELLCSVNDSTYVLTQGSGNGLPAEVRWRDEKNGRYSANFADTDGDGQLEILTKDFRDYFIFEGEAGGSFSQAAKLEDITPNYQGSVAPRSLTADFDGDGRPETIFGDFDGDFVVYEHVAGNQYQAVFSDTSALTKSGNYLCAGDFDGDGQPEWFVAAHTSPLANADNEYDPAYLHLRIFEATGNNQYAQVWEDYLYDLDLEAYNAATAGNLDADPADELIFTSYPRSYVLDQGPQGYFWRWFSYGHLATHHVIGDFDGNGINEMLLGGLDSAYAWERDLAYAGPAPVEDLRGRVLGPQDVSLSWGAAAGASEYEIWRIRDPFNNDTALVLPFSGTAFRDEGLEEDQTYLYVLRSVSPGLPTPQSGFGNALLLRPHRRPRLDSVRVVSPRQLMLYFDQPMRERESDRGYFVLDGSQYPVALSAGGDPARRLLISFAAPFAPGAHSLSLDTLLEDRDLARLDPAFRSASFDYQPAEEERLFLLRWEARDDKTAVLYFNQPLEASALDTSHYALAPYGRIVAAAWASDHEDAVALSLQDARIGALGYAVSLRVEPGVCSVLGLCMGEEGNTATFSSFRSDLSEVYAYPNPVRPHALFEGMRFANLTRRATVEVFSASGRRVRRLEEQDGDGGLTWDLLDEGGRRIRPGIYLYRVHSEEEGVADFVGKFTVVE